MIIRILNKNKNMSMQADRWEFHDNIYELKVDQMSTEWMKARQYRYQPSKWNSEPDIDKLTYSICNNIINIDDLSQECKGIIANEENVRKCYIMEKEKIVEMKEIYTPGLIIPNPFDDYYNFVPKEDRYLLVHVSCSPDLLFKDPKTSKFICAEFKQPINGVIYPDVLRHNRPRKSHNTQINGNGGITKSLYNDYYIWTEKNGTMLIRRHNSLKQFQTDVLSAISFIKKYIITKPESINIELPNELREYYLKSRYSANIITN